MLNFHTNEWQNGYAQAQADYSRLKKRYPHADVTSLTQRLRKTPLSWILKSQDYQMGYESYLIEISIERQSMADYTTKPPVPRPIIELDENEQTGYDTAESLYHTWLAQGATPEQAHNRLVMERHTRTANFSHAIGYAKFANKIASVLDQRHELDRIFNLEAENYPQMEEV